MPYWRIFFHIVWATNGRYPTIDEERAVAVRTSIIAVAQEHRALVHAVGIMPDHVHVAISIPPSVAVAQVVKGMKGRSSRLMNMNRAAGQDDFAWQPEYGVLSFGERSLPEVVAYIQNQHHHHATQTVRPTFERLQEPGFATPPRSQS